MKDFYSDFNKDELWLVKEGQWARGLQNVRETQFALGNGYLGTRGILEEVPYDAMPGTYIAGIYDKMGSQVDELVNLPNPINFRFTIEGEKLDLIAARVLDHKRTLNLKKAVLTRHTLYQDTKSRRYDYQSLRFVSLHNKNIIALQIIVTPLDDSCVVDVNTGIDTSVSNAGVLSEGRKRHFRTRELGQLHNAGYLAVETMEKKNIIVYWAGFYYQTQGKKIFARDNVFRMKLKKGQTVVFTKICFIKHFPYRENHFSFKNSTFKMFNKAFCTNLSKLLADHIKAWERLWQRADISIAGVENLQRNLRFNIYHLLACAHYDQGASSIGARTLSGEGYRGHIFWDTEIFMLPFYLFTFPEIARNILLYRYKRLDAARELARKDGYSGAKFAWESADTGAEETPEWAKDLDQSVIKIYTHKQEHHISADIAYAVYKYYVVSGDEKFMEDYGYELFFEITRFWASRVAYNKKKAKYEINHVIGPDEFHLNVNNNAFTNLMAKWCLITAGKLFANLKGQSAFLRKLKERLKLSEREIRQWKKISANVAVNINQDKVIEQFQGYFKYKKVTLDKTDESGIPLIPVRLKPKMLSKTQLIKQADVIMLLCLLDDVFSAKTKQANYNFYMDRIAHKSSLSPSVHSLFACEVGDLHKAYNLFKVSLHADISNIYGNTHEGVHAASLGGTWQALVFGFAGVKVKKEKLMLNPRFPRRWGSVGLNLSWRGDIIKMGLSNDMIKLKLVSSRKKQVELGIFDQCLRVKPNKSYLFRRNIVETVKGEFY